MGFLQVNGCPRAGVDGFFPRINEPPGIRHQA
jgi:hypothetical protein